MDATSFITLGISILGAFTAVYIARGNRDMTAAGAWEKLLAPLRERVQELENKVESQDSQINSLTRKNSEREQVIARHEDGIRRLAGQVVSLGGQPVYRLPEGHQ